MNLLLQLLQKPVIATCLTGLLLVLGWSPVGWTMLLFVGFVPLLYSLSTAKSGKAVFGRAWLAFAVWFAGTMYWVANVALQVEDQLLLMAAFLLAPALMAVPVWLCWRAVKPTANTSRWYWLPAFWLSYELLHSKWDLAFTWLHLGLGLSEAPALMGLYSFTGPLGGSALILLVNVALFRALSHKPVRLKSALLAAGMLVVGLVPGLQFGLDFYKGASPKVALVQANMDPYEELNERSLYNQVQTFKAVAQQAKGQGVGLIVGSEGLLRPRPEAPIVLNRLADNAAVNDLRAFATEMDAALLLGCIGIHFKNDDASWALQELYEQNPGTYDIYNAALFIPPSGEVQYSTKLQLVPFMEKVPFLDVFPFLESARFSVNQSLGSYSSNHEYVVFEHDALRIAPLICLDGVFPNHARQLAALDANLVVEMSNDGWAGNTSGYLQNASYANAIAACVNRWVVRSANTGVTLVTNNRGQVQSSIGWSKRQLLIEPVRLHTSSNLYISWGEWIGWLALLISASIAVFFRLTALRGGRMTS